MWWPRSSPGWDCAAGADREGGPHLAHAAGLAEGADGPHVALVPGAELRGVVVGRGVQPVAGRPVAGSLQVALATGEKERRGLVSIAAGTTCAGAWGR